MPPFLEITQKWCGEGLASLTNFYSFGFAVIPKLYPDLTNAFGPQFLQDPRCERPVHFRAGSSSRSCPTGGNMARRPAGPAACTLGILFLTFTPALRNEATCEKSMCVCVWRSNAPPNFSRNRLTRIRLECQQLITSASASHISIMQSRLNTCTPSPSAPPPSTSPLQLSIWDRVERRWRCHTGVPINAVIHKWQRRWSARSIISAPLYLPPPPTPHMSLLLSLNGSVCASCWGGMQRRHGRSLFVLADSRVILLPIGVMDTFPLRGSCFHYLRRPRSTSTSIHKSCDTSRSVRVRARRRVFPTSDPEKRKKKIPGDHFMHRAAPRRITSQFLQHVLKVTRNIQGLF